MYDYNDDYDQADVGMHTAFILRGRGRCNCRRCRRANSHIDNRERKILPRLEVK
jgi:hypothetical protein